MSTPLSQHLKEMERNRLAWEKKPLLRKIYQGFYGEIARRIDQSVPGSIIEIGSGIGNLKPYFQKAVSTDIFWNPWIDLVCDGYELPFRKESVSHIILFDVFHHLERPFAFLQETKRALHTRGKLIVFDPYISFLSKPVYELFHHEPVAWKERIDFRADPPPRPRAYYAAQGNATRIFFGEEEPPGWKITEAKAYASFAYLFSGGFSKPALYPKVMLGGMKMLDRVLSAAAGLFGARCLVVLEQA